MPVYLTLVTVLVVAAGLIAWSQAQVRRAAR